MRLPSKRLSFQALIKLVLNSSTSVKGLKTTEASLKWISMSVKAAVNPVKREVKAKNKYYLFTL